MSCGERCGAAALDVPLVVAGDEIHDGRAIRESYDPSFGVSSAIGVHAPPPFVE